LTLAQKLAAFDPTDHSGEAMAVVRFGRKCPDGSAQVVWAPSRRDMIWIDCNPQTEREMKDIHPFLVLSPREFNGRTGIVIGLPMMTASYNESNPFAIHFVGPKGAVSTPWGISQSHLTGGLVQPSHIPGSRCRRMRSLWLARH
jgi:hypothetical protein